MKVLFVLYESFESNSALHVHHLANHLAALGAECAVAVPSRPELSAALGRRDYRALSYRDAAGTGGGFSGGRGPDVVHAWTPRERVRAFCDSLARRHAFTLAVHLEDNEEHLLEAFLGKPIARLRADWSTVVPETLSHPTRYREMLARAGGVTVIVEPLGRFVPEGVPSLVLWPGSDTESFHPGAGAARPAGLDRIPPGTFVLGYTGNVHAANAREVRSVYLAAALLSREGQPAVVLRTGRDFHPFLGEDDSWARSHAVELGFVDHDRMPAVLAAADLLVQPGRSGAFNDYRFPSKLPEYLAMGKPVVLPRTNLGHHLRHLEEALVYPVVDALQIVEAARLVAGDAALARRLGEGALAFARTRLSWRSGATRLLDFYRAAAGPSPARRP